MRLQIQVAEVSFHCRVSGLSLRHDQKFRRRVSAAARSEEPAEAVWASGLDASGKTPWDFGHVQRQTGDVMYLHLSILSEELEQLGRGDVQQLKVK